MSSIHPNIWHKEVSAKINKPAKHNDRLTPEQAKAIRSNFLKEKNRARNEVSAVHSKQLMTRVFDDKGVFQMPGLAIVATYLRRKHGLNNLHVCSNAESFLGKLDELRQMKGNTRAAFILPPVFYGESQSALDPLEAPFHKIAVFIEKIGDEIHIAIMDSMPENSMCDGSSDPVAGVWCSHIYSHIDKSPLDKQKIHLYDNSVDLQEAGFGCESFAMRCGVEFLRDSSFFHSIKTQKKMYRADDDGTSKFEMEAICQLPPHYMKGCQDLDLLGRAKY